MRLIDADALKKVIFSKSDNMEDLWDTAGVLNAINNAPTVEYPFYQEAYQTGYEEGKNERPQGECEKCDFRKFSEKFVDGVVEVMNKNGITSFEQLSEILKGGAE